MSSKSEMPHFEALNRLVPVAGLRVLDIGCGQGWLMRMLRASGAVPTGIECTPTQIAAARECDPQHVDDYVDGVAQDLPFADKSFDLAIFSYSLHHVPVESMSTALAEVHRVLKPGGYLYVLEPAAEGSMYALDHLIDDEAHVRAQAQQALSRMPGFEPAGGETYDNTYVYDRVNDFVDEMVGVDPERGAIASQKADEIAAAFERAGEKTAGGGRAFHQPNLVAVFRRM